MSDLPSDRTKLRRLPDRGRYDRATVHAILDEGLVCHLGVTSDHGPLVLPTTYARHHDTLYLHGARANASLAAAIGRPVCVTVTLLDGLVLARSAFHHSINYRSVVAHGTASVVDDAAERSEVLTALVEAVVPGRSSQVRGPSARELAATTVLRLPLQDVSLKVRSGPPNDDADDVALPYWAGVLPVTTTTGRPVPAPDVPSALALPTHLFGYGVSAG